MPEGTVKQGIGASVRRKEDKRFQSEKEITPTISIGQASFTFISCALLSHLRILFPLTSRKLKKHLVSRQF